MAFVTASLADKWTADKIESPSLHVLEDHIATFCDTPPSPIISAEKSLR